MDNSKLFGEAANEEQLLKNNYRKYRGEKHGYLLQCSNL